MLESAIQKLLILTLFFGESLWKAMDSMIALLANQFGSIVSNGSYWIVGIYLAIYLAGGFFIAWLTYRTIKSFKSENSVFSLDISAGAGIAVMDLKKTTTKKIYRKLWVLITFMLGLSAILFFLAADNKQGWLAVAKTISWTFICDPGLVYDHWPVVYQNHSKAVTEKRKPIQ